VVTLKVMFFEGAMSGADAIFLPKSWGNRRDCCLGSSC